MGSVFRRRLGDGLGGRADRRGAPGDKRPLRITGETGEGLQAPSVGVTLRRRRSAVVSETYEGGARGQGKVVALLQGRDGERLPIAWPCSAGHLNRGDSLFGWLFSGDRALTFWLSPGYLEPLLLG